MSTSAKAASEGGPKTEAYRTFWARFIARVREHHPEWTSARTPGGNNWLDLKSPIKNAHYVLSFSMGGKTRSELYIDAGDDETNLQILNHFAAQKEEIEAACSLPISWEELPGKRACRIAIYGEGDVLDSDRQETYIEWFLDTSARLRSALEPRA